MTRLFYSAEDIAEKLRVNVQTVRKWIRDGRLKAELINPIDRKSGYRITPDAFYEFLDNSPTYKDRIGTKSEAKVASAMLDALLKLEESHIKEQSYSREHAYYEQGWSAGVNAAWIALSKVIFEKGW